MKDKVSMKRICVIYNFVQKYREGIFKLLEENYACTWVFGNNVSDIKGFGEGLLKDVRYVRNKFVHGEWYYQQHVLSLLHEYDTFLMLGELYCISTWLMLIARRLFLRKKRIYLWSHGWYGREGCMKRLLKRIFFGMSDVTFLYGNHAKQMALRQGYAKDNLVVIHNSLNYDMQVEFRSRPLKSDIYSSHFHNDEPVIIFIGRLINDKRLDQLLDSLHLLHQRGKRYNLVVVGDGEDKAHLQSAVNDFALNDSVWFYGACYEEKHNAELLYNADVCVVPGAIGLTAVHAMTYGTPVLTHDTFAYHGPEFETVVRGRTGDFFKYNDVQSIADCIQTWIESHRDDRASVRESCYLEVDESWTPRYQLNQIMKVIG